MGTGGEEMKEMNIPFLIACGVVIFLLPLVIDMATFLTGLLEAGNYYILGIIPMLCAILYVLVMKVKELDSPP